MTLILSGTNGLSDVDGSAATPAIRGTDTNTGMFFPAADTVGIATGGTERARIDSSGNLGLGVTPSAWKSTSKALQVNTTGGFSSDTTYGTSFSDNVYLNSGTQWIRLTGNGTTTGLSTVYGQVNGAHYWYNAPVGSAGTTATLTQAMTLDASGKLLVGWTTAPTASASVIANGIQCTNTSGGGGYLMLGTSGGGQQFYTHTGVSGSESYTERMRIDSSGNLLVGTTSVFGAGGISIQPSAGAPTVDVKGSATTNGSSVFNVYSTGASAYRFYVGMGGTISATSTTITGISDRRLKENIRDLDDGLEKVMALQPRKFDWKEGKGADVKNARGFIAQEFEQVFPDLIEQWKDEPPEGEEPYKAVRADLIPTLVKAIQEQQAIITQLQADVAALKAQ